jgi:hypothetical protein
MISPNRVFLRSGWSFGEEPVCDGLTKKVLALP